MVDSRAFLDTSGLEERIAAEVARADLCAHRLSALPPLVFRVCPSEHLRDRLRRDEDFRMASSTRDFAFHRQDVIVGVRALAAHLVVDWSYLESHEDMLKAHQVLLNDQFQNVKLPMDAEGEVVEVSVMEALDTLLETRLLSIHEDEVWTPVQMEERFAALEAEIELFRARRGKLPDSTP